MHTKWVNVAYLHMWASGGSLTFPRKLLQGTPDCWPQPYMFLFHFLQGPKTVRVNLHIVNIQAIFATYKRRRAYCNI